MNFLRQIFYYITYPLRAIFTSPTLLISAPRRLLGMSLPLRVALVVEFLLLAGVITFFLVLYFSRPGEERSDIWNYLTTGRMIGIALLLIVIPVVVYHAIRLWLEGEVSRFPDIDFAWKTGIEALSEQGIALDESPIFLILGTRDDQQSRDLMNASRQSLRVKGVPDGSAALHWFANPEGIYLVLTQVGRLSKLANAATRKRVESAAAPAAAPDIRGTMTIDSPATPATPAVPSGGPTPDVRQSGTDWLRGTLNFVKESVTFVTGRGRSDELGPVAGLSNTEAQEESSRLEYLCQLVRRARQPLVPINGILTLLPFPLVQNNQATSHLASAARADLLSISQVFRLRCPATALVTEMETEDGFQELVRRVGPEHTWDTRFGKGFPIGNDANNEQLYALCSHACGAFELWAYKLFAEKDGLKKLGNTKLYELLCKIRSRVFDSLEQILENGYSTGKERGRSDQLSSLFSGCYFAAIGPSQDKQAFAGGIFDKLRKDQGDLEWTEQAENEDRTQQKLADMAMVLAGVLTVTLIGMVVVSWVHR